MLWLPNSGQVPVGCEVVNHRHQHLCGHRPHPLEVPTFFLQKVICSSPLLIVTSLVLLLSRLLAVGS